MPSNHFDVLGEYLVVKTTSQPMTDQDLPFVRAWLDDAPHCASRDSMVVWGKLVASLVQHLLSKHNAISTVSVESDTLRLGAYFQAMETLPCGVWWREGSIETGVHPDLRIEFRFMSYPVYDAFADLCYMLSYTGLQQSNPLLATLVDKKGWDPLILLFALESMRERQLDYTSSRTGGVYRGIQHTAQGSLLDAFRPLVVDTSWRPKDGSVYGDAWYCHNNDERNGGSTNAQRGKTFVQRFCACTPSQTDKAMAFILSSTDITVDGMVDFFPLCLTTCPALPTLDALVALCSTKDQRVQKRRDAFEALLRRYHPELFDMLHMHLSVFPHACESDTCASSLLASFHALAGNKGPLVWPTPPGIFEETTPPQN